MGGDNVLDSVKESLGVALPPTPGWVAASGAIVLWQAFDEWLLLTAEGAHASLLDHLREALSGRHAALTDVSDLHVAFEITGPLSRELLAKGCAVDLHPREFKTGCCATTAFARVRATLLQLDETPQFQLLVERSYAQYVWDWLVDAAAEFAAES